MLCQYPCCRKSASVTFALIPLCKDHHGQIESETNKFYERAARNGLQADEPTTRKYYYKIAPLIKWSKYNMEHVYSRAGRVRGHKHAR